MNLANRQIISHLKRFIKEQIFKFVKGWRFFAILQLYVIWLISVIQRTFSWPTWDSHGFFSAYLIYIFYVYHLQWFSSLILRIHRCMLWLPLLMKWLCYFMFHVWFTSAKKSYLPQLPCQENLPLNY